MKLVRAFLGGMLAALVTTAYAQQGPVLIYGIMELSGTGATPGTNFDNGVKLAVKEINAAGGILGRKIDYQSQDTQTNPGVAKAVAQKAVDQKAYVVLGPVHSGSMIVSMGETRQAEITNFTGGEAAVITKQAESAHRIKAANIVALLRLGILDHGPVESSRRAGTHGSRR